MKISKCKDHGGSNERIFDLYLPSNVTSLGVRLTVVIRVELWRILTEITIQAEAYTHSLAKLDVLYNMGIIRTLINFSSLSDQYDLIPRS
jgi:hypothetical protein